MNTLTLTDGSHSIVFQAEAAQGWIFHRLTGWYGQTADKIDKRERPQADGAFPVSRSLRTGRGIDVEVAFRNGTAGEVEEAIEDLTGMGASGPITAILEDARGVSQRSVTVDVIADTDSTRRYTGDASISLYARDSRRYSPDVQSASTTPAQAGQGRTWPAVWPLVWPAGGSSGRITLTNTGKAPSAPTFILEGGFDTALITCLETGARIGLNRQVPVGSEVVIDTKTRRATIDGQSDVSRWLQYREWELIPPGASRTYQFDATGVVSTSTELARNLLTNPSFEATGSGVEVKRNYALSPFGTATLPGYFAYPGSTPAQEVIAGGISTAGFTPLSLPGHPETAERLIIPAGAALGGGIVMATGLPAGDYVASAWIIRGTGPTTQLQFAVRGVAGVGLARTFAFNTWTYVEEAFTVTAGQAPAVFGLRTVNAVDPAQSVFLIANMQVAPAGQNIPQGGLVISGAKSDYDPDLTSAWTGTPEASPSVLRGVGVAEVVPIVSPAFRSTQWAKEGTASLRLVPNASPSSRSQVGTPTTVIGRKYTVVATARLTAPLTGSLSPYSRIVEMYEAATGTFHRSAPAPNVAGEHEVRLTYTATATSGSLRLWNGAINDGGDIWWDLGAVVEGEYAGPAFSGSTPPSGENTYAWAGLADASQAISNRTTIHAILEGQVRSAWW